MSLSQKHAGKVVVPWFNITEWIAVRQLIFDKATEDWLKALHILRIWKKRTPLLSAGVEGTLAIMEALTADPGKLTQHQMQSLYCMSCMRFLNLCATNATRQGTFNQTAKDRDLPRELVSLRHDIAHGHKLPSLANLELALKKCLRYVEEKYWNVQLNHMKDFVIEDLTAEVLDDLIYVFVHLTHAQRKSPIEIDEKLKMRIAKIIKQGMSSDKIMPYVEKQLRSNYKRKPAMVVEKLYENFETCCIAYRKVEVHGEKKRIPERIVNRWTPLFEFLHNTKLMPDFLSIIFRKNFLEGKNKEYYQEMASAWFCEVFKWLLKEQAKNVDTTQHPELNCKYLKLQTEVLGILSIHHSNFKNFIVELMQFNGMTSDFQNDIIELCNVFDPDTKCLPAANLNDARFFKYEDIRALFSDVEMDDDDDDDDDGISKNKEKECVENKNSRWKWRPVKDTSLFRNIPLGVLPGQPRDRNPTMDIH